MYAYKEIYPRHTSYCRFPKSLDLGLNSIFCMYYQHEFPPAFVAALSEGQVWGYDGKVLTHDGRLLGTAFTGYFPPYDAQDFASGRNFSDIDYIDKSVAVLVTPFSDSYYHWMFDVLPRLHLLKQSGIICDKYLVDWDGLPFQSETLSLLGIPETKLIKFRPDIPLRARQLVIPSLATHGGFVPDWACSFLRNELLSGAVLEPDEEYRRIYISRADAAHRNVVNEQELIKILKSLGYRVVLPGTLSLAEQITAFASANIVIAPHGAGLANLVFCSPGTKVIEFFSPNYVRHHYWWISSYMSLDYYYFEGLGERPLRNINANARTENITVSLDPRDLIDYYRKFLRVKDPLKKNDAANITDWQRLSELDGWLSQPVAVALQWLVRQLPLQATALELGTSPGRASVVIKSALPPGGRLYHIDKSGKLNGAKYTADDEAILFEKAASPCDMVFINTKSDYNSMREIVFEWYPRLKTGGYMLVHNYGWLPGVKRALMSLGLSGCLIAEGLWCHKKPDAGKLARR